MSDQPTQIYNILKQTFGYDSFRFEQENIIKAVLSGQDTLAIMPTGGGKSLCYQLPALCLDGVTIVISPLISLMQDQVINLGQYDIKAYFLNSTLNPRQRQDIEEKLLTNQVKLLYIAPEGILSPAVMAMLKTIKVSLIAIDEAHCVSQWGHEFRKDYIRLSELKEVFPTVPTIALTATADSKTRQDICEQLELKNPRIFVSTFDRPNIKYMIYERKSEISQLDQFIKKEHTGHTGIVYCLSRKKVDSVSEELRSLGYNAVAYHAGLSTQQRNRAQEKFNVEDEIIVVATIAFGMGIDRPDVRFVAHLDLPKSIEGYYQETGRAGRDGKPSDAWMVYGLADVVKLSRMLETTDAPEDYKRIAKFKLSSMLSLCETAHCRRHDLLTYFGEVSPQKCGLCDCCLDPPEMWDATVEAQKALSTIFRTGQMFGSNYIIDVLRGSGSSKILNRAHNELSVYGIGKDLSKNAWSNILRQLLNLDYIYIKDWEYRNLALSEKARPILRGQKNILLRKLREDGPKAKKIKTKKSIAAEHGREDLFESLRTLRRKLASEAGVPPYIVFSDKTLHDMCNILPRNKDEMLMVHGIGQSKRDKYGSDFMKVIQQFS